MNLGAFNNKMNYRALQTEHIGLMFLYISQYYTSRLYCYIFGLHRRKNPTDQCHTEFVLDKTGRESIWTTVRTLILLFVGCMAHVGNEPKVITTGRADGGHAESWTTYHAMANLRSQIYRAGRLGFSPLC